VDTQDAQRVLALAKPHLTCISTVGLRRFAEFSPGLTVRSLSVQCVDMERKDKVLNLRVSDKQRAVYERAAALEGVSVSALVTSAADARA
jgi:hypothetical protein